MRKHRRGIRFRARRRCKERVPLPYQARASLLSRGELAFFVALSDAVGDRYGISLKTRLADVVSCPPDLWETPHGRRISQKHLDFVLYDPLTARIVAAVELDDRSHKATDRRVRDHFVDAVLESTGVRLIRIQAAYRYDVEALRHDFLGLHDIEKLGSSANGARR